MEKIMSDDKYSVSDFVIPSGIDLAKFSIKHDATRNAAAITIPVIIQNTFTLVNPEDNMSKPGTKKWTGGFAIPKATATEILSGLKKVSDEIMRLDGSKGPYPSAFKDGNAKDGSGLFVKAGGKWADFVYFSAKSNRSPTFTKKDDNGALIEIPATELVQGSWAIILFDLIAVSYGAGGSGGGGKRGTSAWMSRLHMVGGGAPISSGGASQDTSDFMNMIGTDANPATGADTPSGSEFF